jgi:predicted metal-binding membrane protein
VTPEARLRRGVRTPVLVVTLLSWVAVALVHESSMGAHGPGTSRSLGAALVASVLMTVAMMAPLTIPAIRHVRARGLPRRRRRATVLLTVVHGLVWLAGGLVLLVAAATLQDLLGHGPAIVIGLGLAAAWQFSPAKQRCLNRHHAEPPLAAFGRKADRDVLRFAATHAGWCLGACWALMLVPLLFDRWHVAVMLLASGWMWAELLERPKAPSWQLRLPVKAARIVAAAARQPVRQPSAQSSRMPTPGPMFRSKP